MNVYCTITEGFKTRTLRHTHAVQKDYTISKYQVSLKSVVNKTMKENMLMMMVSYFNKTDLKGTVSKKLKLNLNYATLLSQDLA